VPVILAKLNQSPLRRRIADRIRQAIVSGDLHPGERLVERQLAEQVGASLTAIREAIIQLETEGFITKKPNSTTHVTQLSATEVKQIFAIRSVLEAYAFEEAARRVTAADLAHLEKLHVEAVGTARAGDRSQYVHADLAWHERIWAAAQNPFLVEAVRRVVLPLFCFSAIQRAARQDFDLLADARSHVPLLEAIRHKDPEKTRQAFKDALSEWEGASSLTD
jgi:DNA-binding GntR family transcriptional regulator